MSDLRIIGDIGGTNARFAIARGGSYSHVARLEDSKYPTIQEALRDYLRGLPSDAHPRQGALAIAGPVSGDTVKLTNQSWSFSTKALKSELQLSQLVVVNDFVGTAMSVPHLPPKDRQLVGSAAPTDSGAIGVIGPGTGLGVSTLVRSASGWIVLPGEGGHATMCGASDEEDRILDILRARWPHVSAERVLSGGGIVNLYETICSLRGEIPDSLAPAEISHRALHGTDDACVQAIGHFFAMLGTVAGNLALTVGATGGVYIAGGIVLRLKEAFEVSRFRERFEEKGRLRPYLRKIPTYLILEETPALLGLANLPLT